MTSSASNSTHSNLVPLPPSAQILNGCAKWQEIAAITLGIALSVIAFLAGYKIGLFAGLPSATYISYVFGTAAVAIFLGELIYRVVDYCQKKSEVEETSEERESAVSIQASSEHSVISEIQNDPENHIEQSKKTNEQPQADQQALASTIENCLANFEAVFDGWILVDNARPEKIKPHYWLPDNNFIFYMSVKPSQMKRAIPLVIAALLHEEAPAAILAFQSQVAMNTANESGKEFAIVFPKVENGKEDVGKVEQLLTKIHQSFIESGIEPNKRFSLERQYVVLKHGIGIRRRPITCVRKIYGSDFFYYGQSYQIDVSTDVYGTRDIVSMSEMKRVFKEEPNFIHNPLHKKDPFENVLISNETYLKLKLLRLANKSPTSPIATLPEELIKLMYHSLLNEMEPIHTQNASTN